jgi:hypothetical protein
LFEWLAGDPSEEVREAALRGLAALVHALVVRRRMTAGVLYRRGNQLLDVVLADPSPAVRRAGVRALKPYEAYIDYLDAKTRDKVERLVKSVE